MLRKIPLQNPVKSPFSKQKSCEKVDKGGENNGCKSWKIDGKTHMKITLPKAPNLEAVPIDGVYDTVILSCTKKLWCVALDYQSISERDQPTSCWSWCYSDENFEHTGTRLVRSIPAHFACTPTFAANVFNLVFVTAVLSALVMEFCYVINKWSKNSITYPGFHGM